MAQWLACWAHNLKAGSKPGSAMFMGSSLTASSFAGFAGWVCKLMKRLAAHLQAEIAIGVAERSEEKTHSLSVESFWI